MEMQAAQPRLLLTETLSHGRGWGLEMDTEGHRKRERANRGSETRDRARDTEQIKWTGPGWARKRKREPQRLRDRRD